MAGSAYVFPHEICATPLKIDGHILSRSARVCFGLELTCPMEENIEKWHQSKLRKYDSEISFEARKNGWRFYSLIIEVGARGWVPNSVAPALRQLGLTAVNSICKKLSFIALKSSYVIWLNRFNQDFQSWRLIDSTKPHHGNLPISNSRVPAEGKCRKLTLSKDKDEKQKTKGICDESKHKEIAKDSPPDYQQLIGTVKNMIKRVETRLESLHLRDSKLSDSDVELF